MKRNKRKKHQHFDTFLVLSFLWGWEFKLHHSFVIFIGFHLFRRVQQWLSMHFVFYTGLGWAAKILSDIRNVNIIYYRTVPPSTSTWGGEGVT